MSAKTRSGLQHMTFGVSFNLSLEKVALPDALETLTFGKCFNQPMEKATGRQKVRGKSFRDITVIQGWGKDSCRTFFLPKYTAWRRDPCFLFVAVLIGKQICSRSAGVESNRLEHEAYLTIGTFDLGNGIPTFFYRPRTDIFSLGTDMSSW